MIRRRVALREQVRPDDVPRAHGHVEHREHDALLRRPRRVRGDPGHDQGVDAEEEGEEVVGEEADTGVGLFDDWGGISTNSSGGWI